MNHIKRNEFTSKEEFSRKLQMWNAGRTINNKPVKKKKKRRKKKNGNI